MKVRLYWSLVLQEAFVENLDQGRFFDLLYEGEEDVLKLDILEMIASARQTYLLSLFSLQLRCTLGSV